MRRDLLRAFASLWGVILISAGICRGDWLDDATLSRGERVRQVVADTCAEATRNNGVWPDQPTNLAAGQPGLTYLKPQTMTGENTWWASSATVILYESLADHPSGVWVSFADGHLEFARNAAELSADMKEIEIARRAGRIKDQYIASSATRPSVATSRPAVSGELTLRILNPDGDPVQGALVGLFGAFGDAFPGWPHASFTRGLPGWQEIVVPISNRDGLVKLDAGLVFKYRFASEPSVPLFILDEREGLAALEPVHQSEFGAGKVHDVHLQPACRVVGKITSVGLRPFGRNIRYTICLPVFESGYFDFNTITSDNNGPYFDALVPPGDYDFWVYGTDSFFVHHYAKISAGMKELDLQIDLEPSTAYTTMPSKPAPELRGIKAWKNSRPIRLADLRGKIVILDFWGYSCGYCVESMPYLMSIYDEFHGKGVEVIAVHDSRVDSIAEMNRKLEMIRKHQWNGRDLPFPVALDGPKSDPGNSYSGPTFSAYGITYLPTTLVIDRKGQIIEELNVKNPRAREEIARLIGATAAAK